MAARTEDFDLAGLKLTSGEGRTLAELGVRIDDLTFGGQRYAVRPALVPVRLDVSRTTGQGYALRLRFTASIAGPCMRCLVDAEPSIEVDAREIDQPGGGDELTSPYVDDQVLDLEGWARDAFALGLPGQITCRPDCAGLCPVCGEDLNEAGPDHAHESGPDPRWAKLRELKLD